MYLLVEPRNLVTGVPLRFGPPAVPFTAIPQPILPEAPRVPAPVPVPVLAYPRPPVQDPAPVSPTVVGVPEDGLRKALALLDFDAASISKLIQLANTLDKDK